MPAKRWNRCVVCGRFIGYNDFASGQAVGIMVTPDSEYTSERDEYCCGRDGCKPVFAMMEQDSRRIRFCFEDRDTGRTGGGEDSRPPRPDVPGCTHPDAPGEAGEGE